MNGTPISEETKKAIYELYRDPSNSIAAIAEAYNVDPSNVCKIAKRFGAPPRIVRTKKPKNIVKVCPKCNKRIEVKDAMFCCYCGTDIRSPKELLISRINSAIPKLKFIPVPDVKDELHKLFVDLKNELSKGD